MSEIDKRWGVLNTPFYNRDMTRSVFRYITTEHPKFYQNSQHLKASGLTEDEADALCKLLNAGVKNG